MSQEPRVSGGEIQDEIDSLKAELAQSRDKNKTLFNNNVLMTDAINFHARENEKLKAELAVAREQLGLAQEAMQVRAEERDAWREAAGKLEAALERHAYQHAHIPDTDNSECDMCAAQKALARHTEFKKKMEC